MQGRRTRKISVIQGVVGFFAVFTLLLSAGRVGGQAQKADASRLRPLVPFPRALLRPLVPFPRALLRRMSLSIGLGYTPSMGAVFFWDARENAAELGKVTKALRGNASDAARYRRIGELYAGAGDKMRAAQAFARSADLYRRQVKHAPQNAALRTAYGQALAGAMRWDEAQAQLAQAVRLAPHDWQAWTMQGRVLGDRARLRKLPSPATKGKGALAASAAADAKLPPDADTSALWKQAFGCLERAIALAPQQPLPYVLRGYYTGQRALALHGMTARNQLIGLPDYARAARLDRRSPYLLACAAWFAYTEWGIRHFANEEHDNFDVWKAMPEPERQKMRAWRGKVETLTHDADRQTAARAYTALAWLEYEFHDVPPALPQTHLRRALALNPRLDEAAQLLMHTFGIEDEWPSLAAFCTTQAANGPFLSPAARARFTLIAAYAAEKAGQSERAIAQAQSANLLSEDIAACLLLTALHLKHSDRADNLQRAGDALNKCETLLNAPGTAPLPADRADYALLRGLYFALSGHLDEARQQIAALLQTDPDNEPARKVQQALSANITE